MGEKRVTKKRILVATGLYPPDIGGPATYTKMLETHLPKRGVELTVAPYGWVRRYPKIFRHTAFMWKLIRESRGCDAIYALDPVSVGLPALIASKITRKPLFLRIVGDYAWEQGQLRFGVKDTFSVFIQKRYSYGFIVSALSWVESFVARRAELVIIPCEYLKTAMGIWGVDPKKMEVIHSALFPLQVSASKEAIRTQLNYSGIVIVTAGRLVPNKGFKGAMGATAELIKLRPEFTLVIIGDGPLHDELVAYAEKLGIAAHVRLVGRLSKDALAAAVSGADIFMLNTEHEGFSHQLLEVMDLRVPVVTTNVGGNPELITHKETGLLVAHDDVSALTASVLEIMDDSELRERIVANAYMKAHEFDQDALVDQFVEAIK